MTNSRRTRSDSILMRCSFFFMGALALVNQAIVLREFFVVVYGSELSFGITLGGWLLGIFLGSLLGGYFAHRSREPLPLLSTSILMLGLIQPAVITLIRWLHSISYTPAGATIPFFKATALILPLAMACSFLIGFVFPLAVRINSPAPAQAPYILSLSQVYVYEALGSLVGCLVYTFLWVGWLNPYRIGFLLLLPLLLAISGLLFNKRHSLAFTVLLAAVLAETYLLLSPLPERWNLLTLNQRFKNSTGTALYMTADSKYQNIALAKSFDQYSVYSNGQLAASFPNDEENQILAAHLICQHPAPRRILILGEAVSGLATYLLQYNGTHVTGVEMDRVFQELIVDRLTPLERSRLAQENLSLIQADPRYYIRQINTPGYLERFDIVFVNLPEPSTILLNRYYTREFFEDVKTILNPRGVMGLRLTSSENYAAGLVDEYTRLIATTIRDIFPFIAIAPGMQNFFFASLDAKSVTQSPSVLAQRYSQSGGKSKKLGQIFQSLYPKEKTEFITRALARDTPHDVNSDFKPLAVMYFNKILGWTSGSNLAGLYQFFESIRMVHILLILGSVVGFAWFSRNWRLGSNAGPHRWAVLVAVGSAGFCGLSLEMINIFSFQNMAGYIYQSIGLMTGLFMLGLALGTGVSQRFLLNPDDPGQKHNLKRLWQIEILLALVALVFLPLLKFFSSQPTLVQSYLFFANTLTGFLVGTVFPLASHLFYTSSVGKTKTAGRINAADHAGAAVGALLTGSLLVPLLGTANGCLLLAMLALTAAVLLLISKKTSITR